MKAVYFVRSEKSDFHIHAGSYVRGVYIPEEQVTLVRETVGTFGGTISAVIDRPQFQEDIRQVLELANGTAEVQRGNVSYSHIREFECESGAVKKLIHDAKAERELRARVESGIEDLILKQGSGE